MEKPFQLSSDVIVFPSSISIPAMGILPVNALLLKSKDPVLVDTGMGQERGQFLKTVDQPEGHSMDMDNAR